MFRSISVSVLVGTSALVGLTQSCADGESDTLCGNGSVEDNEECDGNDLGGESCSSLGLGQGALRCDSTTCRYDAGACQEVSSPTCNNNALEQGEACDGTDLNNKTCKDLGFDSGVLRCDSTDCTFDTAGCSRDDTPPQGTCNNGVLEQGEACDGTDLNNRTCEDLGFDDGVLRCDSTDCTFETTACERSTTTPDPDGYLARVTPNLPARLRDLSSGLHHACILGADAPGDHELEPEHVFCWGSNTYHQVSLQTSEFFDIPNEVDVGELVVDVDAGYYHSCVVDAQGSAWCWGRNDKGQIRGIAGDGATVSEPTRVSDTLSFRLVAAGYSHSCAVTSTSDVYCWGENSDGQLGHGSADADIHPPRKVALPDEVSSVLEIGAGVHYSCVLATTQTNTVEKLFCWGRNREKQLSDASDGILSTPTKMEIPAASNGESLRIADFSLGAAHLCIWAEETTAGSGAASFAAYCRGDNSKGQLGQLTINDELSTGSPISRFVQTEVLFRDVLPPTLWALGTGPYLTCGAVYFEDLSSGVRCWGRNLTGETGSAADARFKVPLPDVQNLPNKYVMSFSDVVLSGGKHHMCLLRPVLLSGPDGELQKTESVYCWGSLKPI